MQQFLLTFKAIYLFFTSFRDEQAYLYLDE